MDLLSFPNELIIQIGIYLSLSDLRNLCRTNKRLNEVLYKSWYYWRLKYINDYGEIEKPLSGWKEEYDRVGKIWSFGCNTWGNLGWDTDRSIQTLHAKAISCGVTHTMVIDSRDSLVSFGMNNYGQADSKFLGKVKAVSCGDFHTLIIDSDDNIWAFGYNEYGQLGLGESGIDSCRRIPTQILGFKAKTIFCGPLCSFFIDPDDNPWSFGSNQYGQLGFSGVDRNIPTQIPNIKAKTIASGSKHTLIIDTDDNILVFGENDYGQLGNGNLPNKAIGGACGLFHTVLITPDHHLWISGNNQFGQLGNEGYSLSDTLIKDVVCGGHHTIVLDINNNLWAFGYNLHGQLGLGDMINRYAPTPIPFFHKVKNIVCGFNTTFILSQN